MTRLRHWQQHRLATNWASSLVRFRVEQPRVRREACQDDGGTPAHRFALPTPQPALQITAIDDPEHQQHPLGVDLSLELGVVRKRYA